MTNYIHHYEHLYLNILNLFLYFVLSPFSANKLECQHFYSNGTEKNRKKLRKYCL